MNRSDNPLLSDWTTPYALPPFDRVQPEHFAPAYQAAWAAHRAELDAIGAQAEPPSFENTLAAFDRSGVLLGRIDLLFSNISVSASTPALQAVERELAAPRAAHESWVLQHEGVWRRVDALFQRRAQLGLDAQQLRLLERVHLDFSFAGAALAPQAKARAAAIAEELANLYTRFSQNLLADETDWHLALEREADLAGLPPALVASAREAGQQRGLAVPAIALSRSLAIPFLTHSTRRDLRERVWRGWISRGTLDAARDNRPVATQILALRGELARLHGQRDFAHHALRDRMAKTPAAVAELLERVWKPARAKAASEEQALAGFARSHALLPEGEPLAPWDWRYVAERRRSETLALDDATLKPYFSLEAMTAAMFDCAQRLFGVRFAERTDVAMYHPDVRLYEVRDAAGAMVGLFMADNYARPGKRGGAWMSIYRSESMNGAGVLGEPAPGERVLPFVVNNNNFAKAPAGEPTLIGLDDVRTLFHEFGHGLHGLLSQARFKRLAGTNVLRDFVELPSQLFEHWAFQPEVMARHARHVKTGEPIPAELVEKALAARNFGQVYDTIQYVGSALIDMALHAAADPAAIDLDAFEAAERERLGVPANIGLMHRPQQFRHLFSGDGYAAGYYVYLWAEVLDADAFAAFRETGDVFDAATARRLLDNVYAAGDTVEPGATYRAFRGRDARVEPMLAKKGLIEA